MAAIEKRLVVYSSLRILRRYSLLAALLSLSFPLGLKAELTNGPVFALGLTNVPIGESKLDVVDGGILFVDEPGLGGVSVLLGETDSGVFLYPLTGYVFPGDSMEGKAYGRVGGLTNRFISSIHGIHDSGDGFASGTVTVDFSALGATRVSVFVDNVFRGRISNSIAPVVVYGNGEGCRANPWWRQPDGSYGAIVELASSASRISIPISETDPVELEGGTILFLRPDDPTNTVDFVSRVDVTSTGFSSFCLTDARLGVFQQKHKALGQATLYPTGGRLVVGNLVSNFEDGVFVELPHVSAFDVSLLPLNLPSTNSMILVSGFGTVENEPYSTLGTARIDNPNGVMRISVEPGVTTTSEIEVRSNGIPVGFLSISNTDAIVTLSGTPLLSGVALLAKTPETLPGFAVRVDGTTQFTLPGQRQFEGDEVRILTGEPVTFQSLESLVMVAVNVPSFTITNERASFAVPPILSVSRGSNSITLSWPDPNKIYIVQGSPTLTDDFESLGVVPEFDGSHGRLTLPVNGAVRSQFFRLRKPD